jgi:hypothetical protein
MIIEPGHYSHHNSVGKNYDNSFTVGSAMNGVIPSAKGNNSSKRPQSS